MLFDLRNKLTEIPISSPDFPAEWKGLSDCPKTLYALGDISLLRAEKLVVVGARRTPAHALRLGMQISKELSSAFVITTGTADGGDTAAIEGALQGTGRVICLLAGGFSALPQSNLSLLERVTENGLLLSPHPFETEVRAFSYEYRNKLLATFSKGVLVLGAAEKSGALITAKHAKALGKPIFALPYAPGSAAGAGCNKLIKEGGILTETAEDIESYYGIALSSKKPQIVLSEDENKVYVALKECAEGHITELATRAGIPSYKIRSVLSALEVKGLAVNLGGNRYAPV